MNKIDTEIDRLVADYGLPAIISALARFCNRTGRVVMFRRLNKIYEWMTE